MGATAGTDFLNSDFPMYAAGAVGVSILYRAYVSKSHGEPLQPEYMSKGVFPAVFFTFIGTMACHEMFLDMTGHPGGLTAWAPAVIALLVASWVAYRGQLAASGGELGLAAVVPVVAFATLAISWLVADEKEPEVQLTKAQMKKAAKEAARRAAQGIEDSPNKMLFLEKGKDVITEQMHIALGVFVIVALILGLVNGPGVWPRSLQQGAFPACFMVAAGVLACNSFLRQARTEDTEGSLDDFFPAFAAFSVATLLAHRGSVMQAPQPSS
ncbi:unnamed protein product [Scytosiphon promiscuus]